MHQMRISTTQVSSVMLRSKRLKFEIKCEKWKSRRMIDWLFTVLRPTQEFFTYMYGKTKKSAMKYWAKSVEG
jgi:hypothetical protein